MKEILTVFCWLKLTIIFLREVPLKHIFLIFFYLLKFRVKFGVLFDFNIKIMDFGGFFMGGE